MWLTHLEFDAAEISFDRRVDDLDAAAAVASDEPVNVLGFSQERPHLVLPVCDAGLFRRPAGGDVARSIQFRLHPDGTRAPGRSSRRGVR